MQSETLADFWHYRELFYFLAWRDIKIKYKQTALGVIWALIQPLFTMIVFTLLFGKLAGLPSDGVPYPVFYFTALLPWIYFASTLATSSNSLVGNANLLTKIYFPRVILPASGALTGLPDFFIGFLLLLALFAYYRIPLGWSLLLWPLLLILLFLLAFGVSLFLAALNVKYRDVKHAVPFAIQLWLFVTPIIYPASMIPRRFRMLVALNPLSGIIEAFRFSLLPERQLDWRLLGVSIALTFLILIGGFVYFRKVEQAFADIV